MLMVQVLLTVFGTETTQVSHEVPWVRRDHKSLERQEEPNNLASEKQEGGVVRTTSQSL
jgi:hypothetical protein